MTRLRENFRHGTITDNPLSSGATTFNSAELASLTAVTGSDTLAIVLDPEGVYGAPEIVLVTAHTASATSATITRAQEGTTARQHPFPTVWEHVPTATDYLSLQSITQIAAGTTTYTTPTGIRLLLVEAWGPGGGGAGSATAAVSASAGGGGRSGAYARKLIVGPLDATYPCVVGVGGAGGAAGANNGSAGSAHTTFGTGPLVSATLGGGGTAMAAGVAMAFASGGFVNAAGVGDLVIRGGYGFHGTRLSGTVAAAGEGGAAPRGGSNTLGAVVEGAGTAGLAPGGGGSGAVTLNGGTARAGGDGADGLIIVSEYG